MVDKKKGKFGTKAEKRFGDGITMASILSDEEEGSSSEKPTKEENTESRKTVKPQNRQSEKPKADPTAKKKKPEKLIVEGQGASSDQVSDVEKVEHTERHFFYFTEELTFDMITFMNSIKPREKNKNRLVRALLHMFFDNPKEEQERLYREALEKFKDKVG